MIAGVRHLAQWAQGFLAAAWCSKTDDAGGVEFVGHGTVRAPADVLVFEPALSTCEACLRARSLSLNAIRPTSIASEVQRVVERRGYTNDCPACAQPHVDLLLSRDTVDAQGDWTAICPTCGLLIPVTLQVIP